MLKTAMALLVALFLIQSIPVAEADGGRLVGTYSNGKRTFNVHSVPEWQSEIYSELGISYDTVLLMRTVNQLECGDENGFCKNRFDAGPFQINQIHKTDYRKSVALITRGLAQIEEAKASKNWSGVIATRNELFRFQASWTFERMKRLAKQYGKKVGYPELPREKQIWYQAVWHNGNTSLQGGREFRFWYGDKAVKHWRILSTVTKRTVNVASYAEPTVPKTEAIKREEPEPESVPDFPELEAYVRKEPLPETGEFFIR